MAANQGLKRGVGQTETESAFRVTPRVTGPDLYWFMAPRVKLDFNAAKPTDGRTDRDRLCFDPLLQSEPLLWVDRVGRRRNGNLARPKLICSVRGRKPFRQRPIPSGRRRCRCAVVGRSVGLLLRILNWLSIRRREAQLPTMLEEPKSTPNLSVQNEPKLH